MKLIRALTIAAGAATVALAMLTACSDRPQAPAISYTLLDGHQADLASLRGRVVLVNFWATDCAPCVEEMPRLADTWRRLAPAGFDALAVSMSYDPPFAVSNFAKARRLPFGVAIDLTGEIAAGFGGVRYTPTSVLIDRRGRIVDRWVGRTDFAKLERRVAELAADKG